MAAIWKGAIRFGLVSIPVALAGAETRDDLDFDLLDKRDLSPIGYETVNKRTGRRVERQHVVAGLRQYRNLMASGVRQFGEAVGKKDHRGPSLARFDHSQPHTVGLDGPLGGGEHNPSQAQRPSPTK